MNDSSKTNPAEQPLKPTVTYVIVKRWPEDGTDWVHPEDQDKIAGLFPSDLIFRRELLDDGYYCLSYGDRSVRVQPILVNEVPEPKFSMGEMVTLKSNLNERKPYSGKVYAVRYSNYHHQAQYYLQRGEKQSQTPYLAEDLMKFEQNEYGQLIDPIIDDDPDLPRIPLD
ncbi:MAG: hypothetical protein COA78_32595 [Blastopirellula sp.]|nr:MAG: hypothetical protein COA78_32595 [Blastopirellula sp.]